MLTNRGFFKVTWGNRKRPGWNVTNPALLLIGCVTTIKLAS